MIDSTWDAVIAATDALQVDAYVCFAESPTGGTAPVVIAGEEDWEDDDDAVPSAAASRGMTSCLTKGELTQILENLRQQDAGATLDLRRRAIAHYLQYDAFLVLATDRAESQ